MQQVALSTGGRNLWNYVMWAPEPLQAAHYAAYPRWLPRLAIQAGTSERGCCPACGAPWLRILDRAKVGEHEKEHERYGPLRGTGNHGTAGFDGNGKRYDTDYVLQTTTRGWRQSCRCAPHEPAPCTVLDIFSGSGTTVIEANALGRHGIGIELQEKYVAITHERLRGQPLSLFAYDGQAALERVDGDAEAAAGELGAIVETTKQEQHPNPTVRGFSQRWKAKQRALKDALDEAAG
jgi:hypothetical protein